MVRLKNRYLLVNILYPELGRKHREGRKNIPDVVEFNQPTTDAFTVGALLNGLRAEIVNLFGDYGSGAVSESIAGNLLVVLVLESLLICFYLVKYLSPATSTFILRVSRAHYRIAWAALSLMTQVPVKEGRNCVFRVVRVSGTIRKAEEEAIQRARQLILKTRRQLGEESDSTLNDIFGRAEPEGNPEAENTKEKDILIVDRSDSEEEEEGSDDGDG
jgi:ribonuclease P/MRP protein subunit POP5